MSLLQDLANVLHSISVSLQFSMFLPATLLVVGLTWLISPDVLLIPESWLGLSLIVLTLSYLFYSLNRPFMRFLEGYAFPEFPIFRELRERRLFQYGQAWHRCKKCEEEAERFTLKLNQLAKTRSHGHVQNSRAKKYKKRRDYWLDLYKQHKEYLTDHYPDDPRRILPTEFGHTMLMAELYSKYHYGMDIVTLWTRFVPTLKNKGFIPYLEEAKGVLDFLVNLLFVNALLWGCSLVIFAITGRAAAGCSTLFLPIAMAIFYIAACKAARHWGTMMNVACDLYRSALCADLNLRQELLKSLADEKEMWQGISTFLHAVRPEDYDGFNYNVPFPTSFAVPNQ